MLTGRVAVLRELGADAEIEEYPVPDPEPGGMVLKMEQAGVCGSDLSIMRGISPVPAGGRVLGHEGFGTVFRLGAGITTDAIGQPIQEGDRVVHSGVESCMRCRACARGEFAWCSAFSPSSRVAGTYPYFFGAYADYFYVPAAVPVYKVPDGIPDSILTFVNCALGTVTDPMLRVGIDPGKTVVVQGAGGVGLTAIVMLRVLGAQHVIALDRQPRRLELARRMGATETINIDEIPVAEDRVARVRELNDGRGADLVMELVGHPSLMEEGIRMLDNGGTFVQVGLTKPGDLASIPPVSLLRGKTIMGSIMYRPHIIATLLDVLSKSDRTAPLNEIVTKSYPLADINQALKDMEWRSRDVEPARAAIVP